MKEAFLEYKKTGVTKAAFGDLFLEDIRSYRDRMMASLGMTALYPVWGLDTRALACSEVCARRFWRRAGLH